MTKKDKESGVGEELQIAVSLSIQKLRITEEQKELEFPSSLTAAERAYIHRYCQTLGLKSKSRGKGANRYLTVYKKEGSTIVQEDAEFHLGRVSQQHALALLQRYPVSARERQELLPPTERERMLGQETRDVNRTTGRLNNGIPQVPPRRADTEFMGFRQSLPIWTMRDEIVSTIFHNQVVMITGDTGCGKTTQVPQFILEHCQVIGQPCRIITTQPRRLAALSVAERVAAERDEKAGQTVGYQIRLESRVSPKTLLTFCTNGVLLRTLMGGDAAMATVTHILVDEVHERDRFSDFLLLIIRDLLMKFRNLKLILMSATIDVQLFVKYFGGCPVIHVPGWSYEVQTYFLEDVLRSTGYMNKAMQNYKKNISSIKSSQQHLATWCQQNLQAANRTSAPSTDTSSSEKDMAASQDMTSLTDWDLTEVAVCERVELEPKLVQELDQALQDAWLQGTDDCFAQLLHIIMSENVSVDYQHSETTVTALMVAAGRGNINAVEKLLNYGANVGIKCSNEWTAIDWARFFKHKEIVELLEAYMASCGQIANPKDEQVIAALDGTVDPEYAPEVKELLDAYNHSISEDMVDVDLIMCLLSNIHSSQQEGAILVFLPGYDEIVTLRDRILADDRHFGDSNRYIVYVLHSQMQSSDQKRVFKPVSPGVRKIILSTNIAETSITINDVVFVIDSGKVKEKSYDGLMGVTMLKAVWISQSSALQRRGRAGRCRPGVCYHLFSRHRFCNMQKFQQPEILSMPIHEICLQTKLLAPPNVSIADFLARAPDPPAFVVTRSAVSLLKTIDALDPWEELTEIGLHLLDLPIEPCLGKMILYSVILKCLDPILTIVCSLAYRDPFLMPSQPAQKRLASLARRKLSAGTYSDHMTFLRVFQAWQKARSDGYERSFCEKNFIMSSTMEMIVGMRTQLLGQLRASGFVRARGGGDIRDLNTNSENWAVVKAALCAGTYPNIIRVDRDRKQLISQKESRVRFHPGSVLSKIPTAANESVAASHAKIVSLLPSDWLIYEEMTRTGRIAYARCCTLVSPLTVALFAGPARLPLDALHEPDMAHFDGHAEDSDSEVEEKAQGQKSMFKLDDWISFKVDPETARLALQLRQKWHALFLRRMHSPSKPWSQVDEAVVRAVVGVLTAEEQALGLQQPSGIGQRPRPIASDFSSSGSVSQHSPSPVPLTSSNNNGNGHNRSFKSPQSQSPRQSSLDLGISEESGNDFNQYNSNSGNPNRSLVQSAQRRGLFEKRHSRGSDERSDSSSVQSVGSGAGSVSGSPCPSPALNSAGGIPSVQERASTSTSSSSRDSSQTWYYVIKASTMKAIEVSTAKGVWAFTPTTENKILCSLKEGKEVYLVFSVHGSGHFQGYARMTSEVVPHRPPEFNTPNLGNCYRIEWVKRANIAFQNMRHLQNPWNENRKVQISRDGQEIEPSVGEMLCRLCDKAPNIFIRSQTIKSSQNTVTSPNDPSSTEQGGTSSVGAITNAEP